VIQKLTQQLSSGSALSESDVADAVQALTDEGVPVEAKADFLTALATKGETVEEISAFARLLRDKSVRPQLDAATRGREILDVVGTGGDKLKTINISSTAGMVSIVGAPNLAYVGSKFASRGMTKHVAVQYGPDNIRVNSVHPGYIKTPMMAAATDADGGGIADVVPIRRMAEPDEVSKLVLFLASEDSSYVSGMEHVIDGGLTAS